MKVDGRLIVVTGASRGIGAATARLLGAKGVRLVLLARTEKDLAAVAEEIGGVGERTFFFAVDLSNADALAVVAERIRSEIGDPDVLINNAGLGRWLFVEETPVGEEVQMIQLPYLAAFACTREFLPGMLKRGSGRIVNVNSPTCFTPWPGATGYTASRWALRGFDKSLAAGLKGTGVGVSHCVFGKTTSEYFKTNVGAEERLPRIAKLIPTLTPEDAAKGIVAAIEQNRRQVIRPFLLWLFRQLQRVMPWAVNWVMMKTGYKRGSG